MPLFQPKTIKNLRLEIMAARLACAAPPNAAPDHQARIAATAPREVAAAAKAAAKAGQADAARALLNEELDKPPEACPAGTTWVEIIQGGIGSLE